jgi:hypothetical protein
MIPRGNGLLKEAIIHLGREPRSKSANRGLPIYPVGLCGRGVFLRNQKLAPEFLCFLLLLQFTSCGGDLGSSCLDNVMR